MCEEQETQSLASRSFQPAWGDQAALYRAACGELMMPAHQEPQAHSCLSWVDGEPYWEGIQDNCARQGSQQAPNGASEGLDVMEEETVVERVISQGL